ncbi:MAG: ribosome silencing factor [Clostridiales bacterium GWF2_38_85]|nr:MAG: ribosome silencing factor [Clostridiales bacterium GWF2_38_85]HBL83462.1 ribosome silencing factor [Clostridiales bacterium]
MNSINIHENEARQKAIELGKLVVNALDSKKANNIMLLGLSKETVIADCFVIATGTSSTHIKSLADEVEFKLFETLQIKPSHIEGFGNSSWILMDYGTVIVHIFTKDAREFYNLERLWVDAENIPVETIEQ